MPFRVRTATASRWWSLHTVFNTHCLCRNLYYSALSKRQFSGNCDDFLQWLERKAACSISSSLFIGNSSYGRSLFASKIIQTGDCILKVPYRVQITADNLLPEIRSLIGEEVGNIAKLATVILIEKKLGQVFWTESELEMIRPSSVYQETIDQKSQIEKDFLAIKHIFECSHQSFGDSTYKDFMHACTLVLFDHFNVELPVGSRAWGSTNGLALIIADRDYAPGEQVLIRYGKFSNATLMLDFGFTIPYNIYDQVQIQFDIPKHDPLRDMKLELLHQYFIPPPEDMKGLSHPVNSFSIKEVKSDSGKGKGLPQSLRALARVLSCTTSQEIDNLIAEAAQTDGRLARRPLQDISKEIQAHMMLLSLFIQLIEERSVAIMSLDSLSLCGRFSVRKLMAQDLLQGELRILKSASAWLENYCFSMT
ncbi:hypothetical protein JHK84_029805 [Glycine max]|nr:hypothetical protein JHK85_030199 [Glycine max]KAG5005537.1 hypothetical protein JHK86_029676 [Glycine max]KAG5153333.1 hypothetical protein JHK84_029805 [Glycine max]